METLPRPEPNRHRRGVELAVALVLSFVAIFALHGQMQPAVLRAETGYYQVIAHTQPRNERTLLRKFWTKSYSGHYTPLAFTTEFWFAKHAGLRPNWWRNRQLFLGALLTFLFFGLIRAAAEQTRPPPFAAALLAAAATLILVAQPLMRDLLQWPFHGLQIGWMIFATATGWALVRLPGSANKGPLLWLIALTAYGSMHVLGLGLAVVTGTVAVFSLILIGAVTGSFPEFKLQVRTLVATLIFLAVAGSAHALAMIVLNDAPANAGLNSGRLPDWHQLVGLYVLFPISIVAGLVGARLDQGLIDGILHSAWAVGAAGLSAIGLFIAVLAKTKRQTRPSPRCAALFLSLFSAVMLITIVAMISTREIQEPNGGGLFLYLTAPRYVLPITVSWLGIGLAALMLLSPRRLVFVPSFRACSLWAQLLAITATSLTFWRRPLRCMAPRTSRCGGIWCKSREKRVRPICQSRIFPWSRSPIFPSLILNSLNRSSMTNSDFRQMNMTHFSIGRSVASTGSPSI
jgi:hypothetical protein